MMSRFYIIYLTSFLHRLQVLSLNRNSFSGPIPYNISYCSNLIFMNFGSNGLVGQIPSEFGSLSKLQRIVLQVNNLTGEIPPSLGNLSSLEVLAAFQNNLVGSIPTSLGQLKNLTFLSLGSNNLSGTIPPSIYNLSALGFFSLDISVNALSGSIPSSLGNLTKLYNLFLQENNLEGVIPSSLGNCQLLILLDLSNNKLSGAIPQQVIGLPSLSKLLNLSRNHFTGSLPMEVGKLKSLGVLDVSNNMLSGELPSSLGSCESLEVLHLQDNFFKGSYTWVNRSIPSSMIGLKALEELDLSRNNLSGEIPKFLGGFVFLKKLDLSFNEFWGAVPTGGVALKNASAISITGNTKLCGGIADLQLPKCKSQKGGSSRSSKLIIPLVLSGLALLVIVMVMSYFFLCSSRRKRKEIPLSTLANNFLQVSYATLLRATDEFSSANLIGAGSFGSVYKGILDDNDKHQLVAVKVFNLLRHGASKSFMAECKALRNIKHRNLVEIITVCSSVDFHGNDFKALVYKYMDRGSLEEWLHPPTEIDEVREGPKSLNLDQRLEIAIDVACALDYLHNHCETPIVHCDLKPSNVLLDNEITGHVSDFGLARFLSQEAGINVSNNHTSSIGIKGTVGYAAPEYGMGSEVSTNGDVYSFGILLLEIFARKRPTNDVFNGDLNLHTFVKMALPERVTDIADSTLFEGGNNKRRVEKIVLCLNSIFRIGIECSAESPTERLKNISDAAFELHSIRDVLLR
ncbi:unnamed protein product [Prunus brigantina]